MIAKKHRFHGHKSVSRVRGSRVPSQLFTVYYSHNDKRSTYRMAVVVSKKTARLAVTRNRIRRRLFESVRKQKLLDSEPIDAVFVVRDEKLAQASATDIDLQVAKACQKMTKR